jgi:protein-tyrosine-phosphatase
VVFLGIDDDGRSRMAAALLAHRSKGRVRAVSASPATVSPDPAVAAAMAQLGVELSSVDSQPLSPSLLDRAELVVVMGYDRDNLTEGRRTEDWCIDDPNGKDATAVRCIRDAIDRRVQRLLIRMGVALPTQPARQPTQPAPRPAQPAPRPAQPAPRATQPAPRATQPTPRPTPDIETPGGGA